MDSGNDAGHGYEHSVVQGTEGWSGDGVENGTGAKYGAANETVSGAGKRAGNRAGNGTGNGTVLMNL